LIQYWTFDIITTFIGDKSYFVNLDSAYIIIASGTELKPVSPEDKNTGPAIMPNQNDTAYSFIIDANNRARSPVAINAQNNAAYLRLNASYTMTGDELFLNFGALGPEGRLIPPTAPPITSFSFTFEIAGTYDYLCIVHPWNTGQVVVQ
jgi:hypothetical protein